MIAPLYPNVTRSRRRFGSAGGASVWLEIEETNQTGPGSAFENYGLAELSQENLLQKGLRNQNIQRRSVTTLQGHIFARHGAGLIYWPDLPSMPIGQAGGIRFATQGQSGVFTIIGITGTILINLRSETVIASPQIESILTGNYDAIIEASTMPSPQSEAIGQAVEALFDAGAEEFFEDGTESGFSKGLTSIILSHGNAAIDVLSDIILGSRVNPDVASEALRSLGRIEQPPTHRNRLGVLARALQSSDPQVRYGAALGLASMDDPQAIAFLARAIEGESIEPIRQVMKQVLAQLEATQNAASPQKDKVRKVATP